MVTITEYSEEEINNIVLANNSLYKKESRDYDKLLLDPSDKRKKRIYKVITFLKNGMASIPLALSTMKGLGLGIFVGTPLLIFTADIFIIWRLKRNGKISSPAMINAIIAKFGKHLITSVVVVGAALVTGLACSFFLPGIGTIIGVIIGAITAGTITDVIIEKHIKEFLESEIKPEVYSK